MISFEPSFFKSRARLLFDLLAAANNAPFSPLRGPINRALSGRSGDSILITSAPWSPNKDPAKGPDTIVDRSITFTPSRGPFILFSPKFYLIKSHS